MHTEGDDLQDSPCYNVAIDSMQFHVRADRMVDQYEEDYDNEDG